MAAQILATFNKSYGEAKNYLQTTENMQISFSRKHTNIITNHTLHINKYFDMV